MQQGVFDFTAPAAGAGGHGQTVFCQQACLAYRRIALPDTLADRCADLEARRPCQPGRLALALGLGRAAAKKHAAWLEEKAALDAACDRALSVPAGAVSMDILCRSWQPGDERITSVVQLGDFINPAMRAWAQDNCLCLCWQGAVYTLPIAALGPTQTVKHKLLLPRWNKPLPPSSPHWKPHRLTVGGGGVYVPAYHQLAIAGTDLVLRVPGYELPALLTLLGRSIFD